MTQTDTVLLVDDDPTLRLLAARTLREHGYQVLEASNGAEALQTAHDFEGNIDLLLADVIMPEMRGDELASRMKISFPFTKVLLVSTTADDAAVRDSAASFAFLAKPFAPDALARKVREVIGCNS
jgi:CheY-like chemotaxis protein